MSMETANQLLRDWRDINRARGGRTAAVARPVTQMHTPQTQAPPLPPVDVPITQSVERIHLTGAVDVAPTEPYGRRTPTQDGVDLRYHQQPPSSVPPRPPPGARVPVPPAYPNEPLLPPVAPAPTGYEQEDYSIPPVQVNCNDRCVAQSKLIVW